MPLDKILNKKFSKKVILKIDVEGFEYKVLLGAKQFIKKNRPIIILEMWTKERDSNFLGKLGYKQKGNFWYHEK